MNDKKLNFESFVDSTISDLSLEEQHNLLEEMKNEWLPRILTERFKDYRMCSFCKKYSKADDYSTTSEKKVLNEKIYIDAGYGDSDTHGEVKYLVFFDVCPICGTKTFKKKVFMEVVSEFDIHGVRIR